MLLLVNINLGFFVCFGDGMTQNCVSFFFCELVGISFNTAGGHWDDSLNTPLHLFGDSEMLSNSPNLAQEHKKIGPSQQETTFLNTLWVLHTFVFVCLLFFTRM